MPAKPLLLEQLPNEIFREILSYLNGVHAFIGFSALSNRFRSLICQYCTAVDFKSIDKAELDRIFQQKNTQQWKSLRLVSDDDKPGQVEYFLEKYAPLQCFDQLKSLSLLNTTPLGIHSLLRLSSILENLVSLTIGSVKYGTFLQINFPKLKHLVLACEATVIDCYESFPQLESVEYLQSYDRWRAPSWSWPSTLKRLKLILNNHTDFAVLSNSLTPLFQLETLELYEPMASINPWCNGHIWQELITSSLPLLKNFRFYFGVTDETASDNEISDMIASFSTPFYVIEKSWFIRCDIKKLVGDNSSAILYSVPLAFDHLVIIAKYFNESITTLPNDFNKNRYRNLYANATTLTFNNAPAYDENFDRTRIMHLKINCYIDFTEWTHAMTSLCSLEINYNVKIWSKNFAHLLSNTPNLRSLTLEKDLLRGVTKNWADPRICHLLSTQIRSLKVCFRSSILSKTEIPRLVSIFAPNCQHLTIQFPMRAKTMGYFVQHMHRLKDFYVAVESNGVTTPDTIYAEFKREKIAFNPSNSVITTDGRNRYRLRKYSSFESYLMLQSK